MKKHILVLTAMIGLLTKDTHADTLSLDTQDVLIHSLGYIVPTEKKGIDPKEEEPKKTKITLPPSGQKMVYFTPSEGPFAGKEIKLLFYAFNLYGMPRRYANETINTAITRGKTNYYPWAKTLLIGYYQLPEKKDWAQFLLSYSEKPITQLNPSISVDPTGKITYFPQQFIDPRGVSITPESITLDLSTFK